MALLFLRAASTNLKLPYPRITLHCDNLGVLSHGNNPRRSLPEMQNQADLIRLIKTLSSTSNFSPIWEWVEGHAVERKGRSNSTLPEKMNDKADRLAKAALLLALTDGPVIQGDFPFEAVKLSLSGQRVRGSPRQALESDWGYRAARELFSSKNIVMKEDFHLVWWEGVGDTMAQYPKMFRVWLTKHISEFCGSNVQQYYWSKGLHSPKCDSCQVHDEYTMHICRCRDPGRDQLFTESITELRGWIVNTLGEQGIASTVSKYLHARGEQSFRSLSGTSWSDLIIVADHTDRLGWDSLLEGRISRHWLVLVKPILLRRPRRLSPQTWCRQLITRLHKIVHRQWTYRNAYIHYKGKEGWTMPQVQDVFDRITEYSLMDENMLLPRHRHLLDIDFERLGSGPSSHRLTWLSDIDSALSAKLLFGQERLSREAIAHFSTEH